MDDVESGLRNIGVKNGSEIFRRMHCVSVVREIGTKIKD
jgi:hypothetical protein